MNTEKIKNKGLVIERAFDAPLEKIWRFWTDPEKVKKWWGPRNFTAPFAKIDFHVGGKYLFCMRGTVAPGEEKQDFWSTGTYKEIVPMKKIVVTDSFADENGTIVPSAYYGMEGFPMEVEVTLTLKKMNGKASKTKMALRYPPLKDIDDKMKTDMAQGWNESLDKLEEALKN